MRGLHANFQNGDAWRIRAYSRVFAGAPLSVVAFVHVKGWKERGKGGGEQRERESTATPTQRRYRKCTFVLAWRKKPFTIHSTHTRPKRKQHEETQQLLGVGFFPSFFRLSLWFVYSHTHTHTNIRVNRDDCGARFFLSFSLVVSLYPLHSVTCSQCLASKNALSAFL